jgi:hypothetical protein
MLIDSALCYGQMNMNFNSIPLQEKLLSTTWFITKLLVMEDIYDYMTM